MLHARRPLSGFSAPLVLVCLLLAALTLAVPARAGDTRDTLAKAQPDVALYYQDKVPTDLLKAFDIVVIDPARAALPVAAERIGPSQWFARLREPDLDRIARDPTGFVNGRLKALRAQGYAGILLDDGQPLGTESAESAQKIRQILQALHAQTAAPDIILRNHLAIAREHPAWLRAAIADGLYARGPLRNGLLGRTDPAVRASAIADLKALQNDSGLATVAVDYCALHDLICRRSQAQRLQAEGLVPYVTDARLSIVGIGALEVLPRTVLMVQRNIHEGIPLDQLAGTRLYSMPLNQLGYDVEHTDLSHLPADVTRDRYAGIVVALDRMPDQPGAWRAWLLQRVQDGIPVAVLGTFGFDVGAIHGGLLGLTPAAPVRNLLARARIVHQDPMMGFEVMPGTEVKDLNPFRVGPGGKALLRVDVEGEQYDVAALTPWGGYSLNNFKVVSVNVLSDERWALQPMDFFRQALRLPDMPVPVVTTENGVRLLFVHIDGDGFPSRSEFPGTPYSAEVLRDQILKKYPIPQTVSVIQGEISRDGQHPRQSARLEALAREIFALPNVELASHTFSHPFEWSLVDDDARYAKRNSTHGTDDIAYMKIPGYTFDMDREIQGSLDYINQRLAPPGKKALILQWSGDAQPSDSDALSRVAKAGVLNINGGDTTITRANRSWTAIAPIGVAKGPGDGGFQVYAAVMNENVYTNDWTGPFYGYRRVLETFELTDTPIRFKPLNLYYHFYSATKTASLGALEHVYDKVLAGPVTPIYTSEYIHKVLDWRHAAVARKGGRWLIQSGDALRQVRWSPAGVPDIAGSKGVSGYNQGPDGTYIHMGTSRSAFDIVSTERNQVPRVSEATGMIRELSRDGRNLRFRFGGYYRPHVVLQAADQCHVRVDGKPQSAQSTIRVSGTAAKPLREHLFEVNCD